MITCEVSKNKAVITDGLVERKIEKGDDTREGLTVTSYYGKDINTTMSWGDEGLRLVAQLMYQSPIIHIELLHHLLSDEQARGVLAYFLAYDKVKKANG